MKKATSKNVVRLNLNVDADLKRDFHATCIATGISMSEYLISAIAVFVKNPSIQDLSKRRKRHATSISANR